MTSLRPMRILLVALLGCLCSCSDPGEEYIVLKEGYPRTSGGRSSSSSMTSSTSMMGLSGCGTTREMATPTRGGDGLKRYGAGNCSRVRPEGWPG